ncbi:MAG: DegV family protein [Clostridia bacterium]|nr:DegV family protein [Clostridia bacterium]
MQAGKDIIYVSMSSGISGSCQSSMLGAEMALEAFPERRIEVIDTLGASLGEGLVAVRAAELRDQNVPFEEAVSELRALSERMFNVFTVDDLMFLRRGGRLCNIAAVVGTVLHIKPILKGDVDGKIVAFAKVRGRKRSIEALAAQYDKLVKDPEKQTVGIAHAACKADADYLVSLLNKNRPPKDILVVDYEPVTGSHVGPGALALFFESEAGVRKTNSL